MSTNYTSNPILPGSAPHPEDESDRQMHQDRTREASYSPPPDDKIVVPRSELMKLMHPDYDEFDASTQAILDKELDREIARIVEGFKATPATDGPYPIPNTHEMPPLKDVRTEQGVKTVAFGVHAQPLTVPQPPAPGIGPGPGTLGEQLGIPVVLPADMKRQSVPRHPLRVLESARESLDTWQYHTGFPPAANSAIARNLARNLKATTDAFAAALDGLYECYVNLGEDTDGATNARELFGPMVSVRNPAAWIAKLIAEHRAEAEREADGTTTDKPTTVVVTLSEEDRKILAKAVAMPSVSIFNNGDRERFDSGEPTMVDGEILPPRLPFVVSPKDGHWEHCTPALIATPGFDCGATLRRACQCPTGGSHDHYVTDEPDPHIAEPPC